MSTNTNTWCSACRQQINSFALRCPHCTTQLDGWTGNIARPYQPPTPQQQQTEAEFAGFVIVGGMLWLVYKGCMWLWACWLQFWNWLF
jgi:hypothetical protein